MHKVVYKNNYNQSICFTEWPYMITGGDIFDSEWEKIENDDHIQGFEKNIQEKKLLIDVSPVGMQTIAEAIDTLENVIEKDVINCTPGKLYVGSSYMNCYGVKIMKDRWVNDLDSISVELTMETDYGYWINETLCQFRKATETSSESEAIGLDYEYDYEYEYRYGVSSDGVMQSIYNSHYTDSGFKMIIYGPCINPAVRIAGHLYELKTTLYDGEYAVIDSSSRYSQDRAIYKVQIDGTKIDLFNSRNKDSEIWKKIPSGRSNVTWNGGFGFDITLYSERGTPSWTF